MQKIESTMIEINRKRKMLCLDFNWDPTISRYHLHAPKINYFSFLERRGTKRRDHGLLHEVKMVITI